MRLSSSRRGMSQGSRRRARAVDAGVVLGQRLRKRSFAQWVCLNGILRIFTLQKCIAHPVSIAIGLCKAGLPGKARVSASQRGMTILPRPPQPYPYVYFLFRFSPNPWLSVNG